MLYNPMMDRPIHRTIVMDRILDKTYPIIRDTVENCRYDSTVRKHGWKNLIMIILFLLKSGINRGRGYHPPRIFANC